jgi:hypothetical protein
MNFGKVAKWEYQYDIKQYPCEQGCAKNVATSYWWCFECSQNRSLGQLQGLLSTFPTNTDGNTKSARAARSSKNQMIARFKAMGGVLRSASVLVGQDPTRQLGVVGATPGN